RRNIGASYLLFSPSEKPADYFHTWRLRLTYPIKQALEYAALALHRLLALLTLSRKSLVSASARSRRAFLSMPLMICWLIASILLECLIKQPRQPHTCLCQALVQDRELHVSRTPR